MEDKNKPNEILQQIYECGKKRGFNKRQVWIAAGKHPSYSYIVKNPTIDTLKILAKAVGGSINFTEGKFNESHKN